MEYLVKFRHPSTGAYLETQIEPDLTADEIIEALVAEEFITGVDAQKTYRLSVSGGAKIEGDQTLESAGLTDGCTIDLIDIPQGGNQ